MNALVHCYRIRLEDWWEFAFSVRKFYCRQHILSQIIREAKAKRSEERQIQLRYALVETLRAHRSELTMLTVALQVFEESAQTLLFRVLETGYCFLNNYVEQGWPVEPAVILPRSEAVPQEKNMERIAEWVEDLIRRRQFFLYPVISESDILHWLLSWEVESS